MAKVLTTTERAVRHRIMAQLRSWIAEHELERSSIAAQFGITPGHLRTLLNSNRTASQAQCQQASIMMEISPTWKVTRLPDLQPAKKAKPKRKATRKPNKLRPLTKAEGKFVKEVAESWLSANKNASSDEYIEIVRALGIGIRS